MPFVSATYLQLLHEHLTARGVDPAPIAGPLPEEGARVPAAQWKAILERAAHATGEPAFGLRLAERLSLRHLGVYGYVLLSCRTGLEALERGVRFHALLSSMNPAESRVDGDRLRFSWPLAHGWAGAIWDDLHLAMILCQMPLLGGRAEAATSVELVAQAPADVTPYESFFRCPVTFGCAMPAISFPSAMLSWELPRADPQLLAILDAQAEQRLQQIRPVAEELQQFRLQLVPLIRDGRASLDQLARENHLSPRTLQRRLVAYDTSFRALLDETRRLLAEQYLADANLELHEVAALLGYADQSSFTRAFQQWTGTTPGQWRRGRG